MPDYASRVDDVLQDYISKKGNRSDAVKIYERLFDDYDPQTGVYFDDFDAARERFATKDWTEDEFERFVSAVREVIDGGAGKIPESYFDIEEPNDLSLERAKHELDQKPYRPEADPGAERDGFEYEVDSAGVIHATWYYTQVSRTLTGVGSVDQTHSEDSIRFRIHPTRNLLVVESTYPISIQKMKKVIREQTPNMSISVTGVDPEDEDESFATRMERFRDSFEEINPGEEEQ